MRQPWPGAVIIGEEGMDTDKTARVRPVARQWTAGTARLRAGDIALGTVRGSRARKGKGVCGM